MSSGGAASARKQSIATRVAVAAGMAAAVAALVGALTTGIFASRLFYDRAEDAAHSTARALAHELHEETASGPAHDRIQDEIVHYGRIEARYVGRMVQTSLPRAGRATSRHLG